ncbi:MAG TPA: hypothetical protein VHE55_06995 [Fimbriimonadaceae bacterium]|nr:hypothetical protein [Fimbriimonadaceae bacterium]
MRRSVTFIAAMLAAISAGQTYHFIDLDPGYGYGSGARAVNASGIVAGWYNIDDNVGHACYFQGGILHDLGTLGGANSEAFGLNSSGQIVGKSQDALGNEHPFIYTGSSVIDLGTLGGATGEAWAINSSGQIVGDAATATGTQRAFLYSGGVMNDLGSFVSGGLSIAYGINDSGVVVGYAKTSSGYHAFRYSGSTMTDIGNLFDSEYSSAEGINASGQITGFFMGSDGVYHGFLVTGTSYVEFHTANTDFVPMALNDSGQVVGYSVGEDGSGIHAFLYSNGLYPDLTQLIDSSGNGRQLYGVTSIRNDGTIAGWTLPSSNSPSHAFLLVPTNSQLVPPTAFSFSRGSLLSGNLGSLVYSDDMRLIAKAGVAPTLTDYPIKMIFTATSPADSPSSLAIGIESKAQLSNITQHIEAFDYSANAFVVIDNRTASTSDSTAYLTLQNPTRFVNPVTHEMKMRVSYIAQSAPPLLGWLASMDRVLWEVTP